MGEPVLAWIIFLAGAVALAAFFWGWLRCNRRLHVLEDLPLSRIESAAQGYARLEGRAMSFPGKPLVSPLSKQVCCWYSYEYRQHDRDGQQTVSDSETSEWSFMMSDGSSECVVDPAGAQLVPARVERFRDANSYSVERSIRPGDPLFVIGQYATSGAAVLEHDVEFRVGRLVADWKKDMVELARRFDLDRDGQFSGQEWERLRAEARREVLADLARNPPRPQNLVSRPGDGRPYIVSGKSHARLARSQRTWAWLNLAGLVATAALLAELFVRSLAAI